MVKLSISIEQPLQLETKQVLPETNASYRIYDSSNAMHDIVIPDNLLQDYKVQFEQTGCQHKRHGRKQALRKIVNAAYKASLGLYSKAANKEFFIFFNNEKVMFKVESDIKDMFFRYFKDVKQDKYAKKRMYVLNALVYYACQFAKQQNPIKA
ncbi:hypothetical protein [Pseudoalteromonas undina]|uniref:Uncharacterized protein n=1 Tax=Pseudoalteromonas undina TaxID=43660 RepID=A0ACC6R1Z9_9GAMM